MITVLKNRQNKVLIYASCIAFFGLMSVLHWNMSLDLSDDGIFKEVLKIRPWYSIFQICIL